MDTNRIKVLVVYLCLIAICSWLFPTPTYTASRGITVKAKTSSGAVKEIPLYSGYHALVIGCGDYRSGWPRLPNPVKDAQQISSMLKDWGWTVNTLKDPDGRTLERELNKLAAGPGRTKERAIFLWYSGHGQTLEEADGTKLGYLVPIDAPDPDKDLFGFMEKAISMRRIETISKKIRSKHVLMAFDSCFSGAIFQTVRAKPSPYIQEKTSYPVRQFMTAGMENEQVPDKSVFKDLFIQGLNEGYADLNQDSYITGEEIGAYLQENVINYSRKAQHPQFGKINNPFLDKGDFVFVKSKKEELTLALMKVKRLEQENLMLRKQLEETEKYKAAVSSSDSGRVHNKLDSKRKYNLAVFPFCESGIDKTNVKNRKEFIDFIIKYTDKIPSIITTHSFYPYNEHKSDHRLESIRNIIHESTEKKIWYGSSRFPRDKPDYEVLKNLAREINSDLILTFKIMATSIHPTYLEVKYQGYLIDLEKNIFYEKKELISLEGTFSLLDFDLIKKMSKGLFESYLKSNLQFGSK